MNFFPFQWNYKDEVVENKVKLIIRAFGRNDKNESVHIKIMDFAIPFWIELPDKHSVNDKLTRYEWTESRLMNLTSRLSNFYQNNPAYKYALPKEYKPVSIDLVHSQKLYYANIYKNSKSEWEPKKFPFLLISFNSLRAVEQFTLGLKGDINSETFTPLSETEKKDKTIGRFKLKCHAYEKTISPILKLCAVAKLPTAGWIKFKGVTPKDEDKESCKKHEYIVSYKNMREMKQEEVIKMPIVYPKVLSFDNEAYSSEFGSMPKVGKNEDKVFMMGCTFVEVKDGKKEYEKVLLSIKECGKVENTEIRMFKNEADMYVGFKDLIVEKDPDVIIGYNIFGWDISYMAKRAEELLLCLDEMNQMGCIYGNHAPVVVTSWESSAYGKQDMTYFEAEGRLFIDLLPYIKRNYKLSNYRLETVCSEFLKTNKDPVKANDMFKYYRENDLNGLNLVAKYCIQDSYVTLLLYEKLLVWIDLVESANTNNVPIIYMYTKGQQIKMYSQVLKYAFHNNIVVESNAFKELKNDKYSGAYVSQPIAGLYKNILPFDFASLYPSIMMAYNVDYSKLVDDNGEKDKDESIPDEICNVFKWSEHQNCLPSCPYYKPKLTKKGEISKAKVNTLCGDYYFRFLRSDITGKGVIPTLLENLIAARKNTRKIIEANENEIEELKHKQYSINEEKEEAEGRIVFLEETNQALDKRQLSYKVSANSMYGAMGARKGYLPFLPGAMCVTSRGRESILKASSYLENECGGKVIYNDTDSAYTYFSCLDDKTPKEIWDYATNVSNKIVEAKLFPKPMKLEFEEKIYTKFLILTKKRYVAQSCNENGEVSKKLTKRGIVLQRRDNCKFFKRYL